MTSQGWAKLIPLAGATIAAWNDERKVRASIANIFRQGFLEETPGGVQWLGLRSDVFDRDIEIAQLCFRVSSRRRVSVVNGETYFYDVTVTRTDLPGGDPKRLRRFRYMTGVDSKLPHRSVYNAVGIRWPPYVFFGGVGQDFKS